MVFNILTILEQPGHIVEFSSDEPDDELVEEPQPSPGTNQRFTLIFIFKFTIKF